MKMFQPKKCFRLELNFGWGWVISEKAFHACARVVMKEVAERFRAELVKQFYSVDVNRLRGEGIVLWVEKPLVMSLAISNLINGAESCVYVIAICALRPRLM